MFSAQNLQINRGSLTSNAQGKFVTTLHTYRDDTATVASIQMAFPPYLGQGANQDEIAVGDHILVLGSDTTTFNKILDLNPFTLGVDLFSGAAGLSVAPPIVAVDANAARITGNILEMEVADATHAGIISSAAQTLGGAKSFPNSVLADIITEITPANGTVINTNKISAALVDFPTAKVTHFMQGNVNIDIGPNVLSNITTANENIGIGNNVLLADTIGNGNVAVGTSVLSKNTSGSFNVGLGAFALEDNVVGANLVAVGVVALQKNTTGVANTAVGGGALSVNTSGSFNVAVGDVSLEANTTGQRNIGMGANTLLVNTIGNNNIAIGTNALSSNINGDGNVAIGNAALQSSLGASNTAVGNNALASANVSNILTAIGSNALASNTSGAANTAVGANCLASNTTGTFNSALGVSVLTLCSTGGQNTAMGYFALTALTTGNQNSAFGNDTLALLTTGINNIAIGSAALHNLTTTSNNIAIGVAALNTVVTGTANIAIGNGAATNYTTNESNNIAINHPGIIADSGVIRLGTNGVQVKNFQMGIRGVTTDAADAIAVLISSTGQLGTVSSLRSKKENINAIDADKNAAIIKKLNPIRFDYIESKGRSQQFGLIAEEVAEVYQDICAYETASDGHEELKTVYYDRLTIMLLKEVQRLQAEIELLKSK